MELRLRKPLVLELGTSVTDSQESKLVSRRPSSILIQIHYSLRSARLAASWPQRAVYSTRAGKGDRQRILKPSLIYLAPK